MLSSVAGWFTFKPNSAILVYFGRPWNYVNFFISFMTIWYSLCPFVLFSSRLLCFVVICYIFPILGILYKNPATLMLRILPCCLGQHPPHMYGSHFTVRADYDALELNLEPILRLLNLQLQRKRCST
jgi:hypothetical protein